MLNYIKNTKIYQRYRKVEDKIIKSCYANARKWKLSHVNIGHNSHWLKTLLEIEDNFGDRFD